MSENRKKNALYISHLGLGDMLVMCGGVRYLRTLYDEVAVVCKDTYFPNVEMMYKDDSNIKLIQINASINEESQIREIFQDYNYKGTYDMYLCGLHKTLIYGAPYNDRCNIQRMFYDGMGLDISIMKSHFKVASTEESIDLFNKIPKNLQIIFVHNCASNQEVAIDVTRFKNDDTIIINPNKNMYSPDEKHYSFANEFINKRLLAYIDIMKNADELHMTDSSFSCLAGLLLNGEGKSQKRFLYTRGGSTYPDLFDSSWQYSA